MQGIVSDTDEEDSESVPVSQGKIKERLKRKAAVLLEVRHNLYITMFTWCPKY